MEYNWQLTEESGIWYIIETKPNTLGVLQERIMTDKELYYFLIKQPIKRGAHML